REVVRAIEKRLGKEASHAEALRLLKAAGTLALMRVPKSKMEAIFEGVGLMSQLAAYDEAILEGETKGRIKGKIEGAIEGEIRGRREVLLQLGGWRFGTADADVEAELAAIRDLGRLDRLTKAFSTVGSWRELLETL
ncbi:MAG: hypothetical protein ACRDD1_04590, partial [Planctomycetia bacterium]